MHSPLMPQATLLGMHTSIICIYIYTCHRGDEEVLGHPPILAATFVACTNVRGAQGGVAAFVRRGISITDGPGAQSSAINTDNTK